MNKISRLKMMENDEDDEGMWVEMLMMNTIAQRMAVQMLKEVWYRIEMKLTDPL